MASNVWDNSQALKIDATKEWTNATAAAIDDNAEDTEWVRCYYHITCRLVFLVFIYACCSGFIVTTVLLIVPSQTVNLLQETCSIFQKQHGTLVFSRSATPPPTAATPAVNTVAGMSSLTSAASGPISFAAVAAAGTNKAKENALKGSLGRAGAGAVPSLTHSQLENVSSLYQK